MNKNIKLSLKLDEFLIYVKSLNIGMETISYYYSINVDYKKRLCSVTEDNKTKFLIGVQKIQYIRKILKPLMIDKNISHLIHILSIAQFYSYLFYDDEFFNGTVDFSYIEKYSPAYLQFSIGCFSFNIYENNIQVYDCGVDDIFGLSAIDETCSLFLNYIQQKISDHLHTDIDHISNKSILLLEMLKI